MKPKEKFWNAVPVSIKMASAAVIGIFAIVSYLSTFQTDAEAAEMEQRISKTLNDVRVDNIEAEIRSYEVQKLDPEITPEKKEWLKEQIEKLEKKADCVRKGEC